MFEEGDMAIETNDLTSIVRALDAEFIKNANNGDAAALTSGFYAADAVLLPPNGLIVRGAAAIEAFWAAFLGQGVADAVIETTEVSASGDLAYGIGTYSYAVPSASFTDTGKFLIVLQRQADGTWKTIADQFNSDVAAS
jgi:ketosteroid isomerase-like protein